jgi:hypothetical protein
MMEESFRNEIGKRDVNETDFVFDWRKRDDAYIIDGPDKSPYSLLLALFFKLDVGKQFTIRGEQFAITSCTGSLLTKEWIITAAHCLVVAEHVIAYAGGMSRSEVEAWMTDPKAYPLPPTSQAQDAVENIVHPRYNNITMDCDVALARVKPGFNLTKTVATVPLTSSPWSLESYKTCSFTGFGAVQEYEEHKDDMVRKTHVLQVKKPCICSFSLKISQGAATVNINHSNFFITVDYCGDLIEIIENART